MIETLTASIGPLPADLAVRAVGLTKRYLIPISERWRDQEADAASYRTLRETLVDGVSALVRGTRQERREFFALRDVTFDVTNGSIVGVIGRNGSGKTTLLKVLSRITEPSAGEAQIRGRVGSLLEVGTGFHPELTGRENIYLSGAILGMRRDEIRRRFAAIVEFAEVGPFVETPLKRFSSGMYLRLAFAVAAHLETEIMLVDEVLAVGDLEFRRRCLGKIRDVVHGGRTVLYVSHDMSSVRSLCDRVVWLDGGRVVQDGAPSDVIACYEAGTLDAAAAAGGVYVRATEESRGKSVWFARVEVRDEDGTPSSQFEWGERLRLLMLLGGEPPSDEFTVDWSMSNERGERVAYGTANPQQNVYFRRSDRIIECAIGPLWLTSGAYRITLSVRIWNMYHWDYWVDAVVFRIVRADAYETGFSADSEHHGSVVIPHEWRVLSRDEAHSTTHS